jgi:hypothetical protein
MLEDKYCLYEHAFATSEEELRLFRSSDKNIKDRVNEIMLCKKLCTRIVKKAKKEWYKYLFCFEDDTDDAAFKQFTEYENYVMNPGNGITLQLPDLDLSVSHQKLIKIYTQADIAFQKSIKNIESAIRYYHEKMINPELIQMTNYVYQSPEKNDEIHFDDFKKIFSHMEQKLHNDIYKLKQVQNTLRQNVNYLDENTYKNLRSGTRFLCDVDLKDVIHSTDDAYKLDQYFQNLILTKIYANKGYQSYTVKRGSDVTGLTDTVKEFKHFLKHTNKKDFFDIPVMDNSHSNKERVDYFDLINDQRADIHKFLKNIHNVYLTAINLLIKFDD